MRKILLVVALLIASQAYADEFNPGPSTQTTSPDYCVSGGPLLIGTCTQADGEQLYVRAGNDGLVVTTHAGSNVIVEDSGENFLSFRTPNNFNRGLAFNEGTGPAAATFQHTYNGSASSFTWTLGGATRATLNSVGDFLPGTDGTGDIGSSSLEWQDLFVDGIAYVDDIQVGLDKPGSDVPPTALYVRSDIGNTIQGIFSQATNDVNGPYVYLTKTRATDGTANTVVQDNDILGMIQFWGAGGVGFEQAAYIRAIVAGTPGNDDMPTELIFATTQDGAQASTEALMIEADQDVRIMRAGAGLIMTSPDGSQSKCTIDNSDVFTCTGL